MIKSNTKQFKTNINNWINNNLEENDIKDLVKGYNSEARYWGYPGIIEFGVRMGTYGLDIYYDDQRAVLKEWFEETDQEAQKFTDDQVIRYYCYYIEEALKKLGWIARSGLYEVRGVTYFTYEYTKEV